MFIFLIIYWCFQFHPYYYDLLFLILPFNLSWWCIGFFFFILVSFLSFFLIFNFHFVLMPFLYVFFLINALINTSFMLFIFGFLAFLNSNYFIYFLYILNIYLFAISLVCATLYKIFVFLISSMWVSIYITNLF